jgi:Tol biopolymer transport system component
MKHAGLALAAVAMLLVAAASSVPEPVPPATAIAIAIAPYDAGTVAEPRLFAEGIVSTEDDESNGSFSPDGTEYYFAKFNPYTTGPRWGILCVSRIRDGRWSEPEVLPFSGQYRDSFPRVSPDGGRLFFTSSRPAPGKTARALRIWSAERTGQGWSEPQPLPAPINAPDNDWNYAASVARDGTLYFASTRDGSDHPHIYRSRFVEKRYTEPEKLGPEINSEFSEADPFVSPDETVLIFSSVGDGLPGDTDRPETLKGGGVLYPRSDLYASVNRNGGWSPAQHLEHGVNTFADEGSPSLSPDGRYLFFTSERSPFSVPPSHRLGAREIDAMLHATLNGHGNVFFISLDALGLLIAEPR